MREPAGTANAAESLSRHEQRRNFYNLQVCNWPLRCMELLGVGA
jgi:hypothetical protein